MYKKPVVAILSTGNEIVDLHSNVASGDSNLKDGWGGIFDTNRPSLQAALEGLGYDVVDLGIVPDSYVTSTFSNHILKHISYLESPRMSKRFRRVYEMPTSC